MKMLNMLPDERPREKMLKSGARALSNAELLAILLRTGKEGKNVIEVAHSLLAATEGSLTSLSLMSVEEFCAISGVGPAKAITICAAMELGKRLCAEVPQTRKNIIKSADDVFRLLIPNMKGLQHEECWLLYLARNNRVITMELLSSGGQSETVVEVKSIVRRALDTRASSVIIAHNHPSGDPHPGNADIVLTRNLRKALDTFSISLLDHVVVSDGGYYSFADEVEHRVSLSDR